MNELADVFADLEDPRAVNARLHCLHDILVIALCTVVSGGQTCTDMELYGHSKLDLLKSFLKLENGIPSHDTFSRVLKMLDPEAFQSATGGFLGFMGQFAEGIAGVVALDGKTLRRSYDRAAGRSPLHLVSAWADEQRLVLGQVAVDDKSNEITAVPKLLEMLSLRGKVVTPIFDQSGHALPAAGGPVRHRRMEQGGDYALALKGNQGTLHDEVKLFLDDPDTPVAQATQVGKGHGRIETRVASVSADIAWLQERHDWPGLQAVGKVSATRRQKDDVSEQTRYPPTAD